MSKNDKAEFLSEMIGTNQFLNNVIYYSIFDTNFLKKIRRIFPLEVFRSKERKIIMREIFRYFDDYQQSPESHFYDMFKEMEKNLSDSDYDKCMGLIGILKGFSGKNSQYILDRIQENLKHYYLEEGAVEFASLIKRRKYDDAKAVILKAMKRTEGEEESDYFDYFTDKSYIETRLKENKHKMKTLIKGLDNIIGGFNAPWLVTILGIPKGGKSYILLELAVAAVFQGLNVIFVSLEMDKNVIEGRLDQMIGFMSSRETDEPQEVMKYKREQWVKDKEVIPSIFDIGAVEKNRSRFKRIGGGGLKVIAHHRGRMNYTDIENVLNEAEERDGFIADVLVVDYLGIMRETAPQQSKKERISENCLGLKELCGKRNLIGLTAMQGNRKAMTAKVFHAHFIADDIDCIHHSDIAISICQTKREESEGKCRLYGAINRHGPQGWTIGTIRDLTIGQPVLGEYNIEEEKDSGEEEKEAENYY